MKCKTYYAADLPMCPVCKTEERVSPVMDASPADPSPADPESVCPCPTRLALEEERERFLREFKSQVYASHTQIDPAQIDPAGSIGLQHGRKPSWRI